jgi:hypothetical protein
MRAKVNLITDRDVHRFVELSYKSEYPVFLTDENHVLVVSAKSILGVKYATIEWTELYAESEDEHLYLALNAANLLAE